MKDGDREQERVGGRVKDGDRERESGRKSERWR